MYRIQARESNIVLRVKKRRSVAEAYRILLSERRDVEEQVAADPLFRYSLRPIPVSSQKKVVQRMACAARLAGVGPFAAVAGAIAEGMGEGLAGIEDDVVVENGGDIYVRAKTRPVSVAIFAGDSVFSRKLAFRILPQKAPVGICTSSGTVGHSLSFGDADAATIVAGSASLADAVATATCNRVHCEQDIGHALRFALSVPGVQGALIIRGEKLGMAGRLPKIVELS
jgi:ApbE superfamily uncharacterized protein (UPF0280 family)